MTKMVVSSRDLQETTTPGSHAIMIKERITKACEFNTTCYQVTYHQQANIAKLEVRAGFEVLNMPRSI